MAQLIEPTALPDLGMTVGFLHIPGAGFRVATEGGGDGHVRHLSVAATRRLATELAEAADPDLRGAVKLLRSKADRLEGWLENRRETAKIAEFEALRETESEVA